MTKIDNNIKQSGSQYHVKCWRNCTKFSEIRTKVGTLVGSKSPKTTEFTKILWHPETWQYKHTLYQISGFYHRQFTKIDNNKKWSVEYITHIHPSYNQSHSYHTYPKYTIDHIITNSSAAFTKVGILVADVSDHLPIFGLTSLKKCTNPFKNTYWRIYHDSKKDDFVTRLKENADNNNLK